MPSAFLLCVRPRRHPEFKAEVEGATNAQTGSRLPQLDRPNTMGFHRVRISGSGFSIWNDSANPRDDSEC
jgi:hypothetical protein